LEPYKEIITDGENGLLASSQEEWNEKIQSLIQDPELRYKLTINAQNLIKQNFLMSKNSNKWSGLYKNFIDWNKSENEICSVPHEIIQNIAMQLSEFNETNNIIINSYKKEKINLQRTLAAQKKARKRLQKIVTSQKRKINNLEEEVLFYAASKSWKITRLLRKIQSRIKKSKKLSE